MPSTSSGRRRGRSRRPRGDRRAETEARTEANELLTSLADDLDEALDGVEQAVDDADGAGGAVEAGTAIVAALTTMGQQVSSTVDELEQLDAGSELSDAFDNADACSDLRDER